LGLHLIFTCRVLLSRFDRVLKQDEFGDSPQRRPRRQGPSSLNRRDLDGFISAFADDAVLYGADGQIKGKEANLSVIRRLIGLSENSLEIDVHDILANDVHTVVLQTTKAQYGR